MGWQHVKAANLNKYPSVDGASFLFCGGEGKPVMISNAAGDRTCKPRRYLPVTIPPPYSFFCYRTLFAYFPCPTPANQPSVSCALITYGAWTMRATLSPRLPSVLAWKTWHYLSTALFCAEQFSPVAGTPIQCRSRYSGYVAGFFGWITDRRCKFRRTLNRHVLRSPR